MVTDEDEDEDEEEEEEEEEGEGEGDGAPSAMSAGKWADICSNSAP
jgi:hypothetical protein